MKRNFEFFKATDFLAAAIDHIPPRGHQTIRYYGEDEDGAVFAADLDRLAGVGALVEQVAAWLRIVVRNPFADGLPRRLEGVDVEGRVRWWRDVVDRFRKSWEPRKSPQA